MAKYPVQLRGGFSDRNNINPENKTMQLTDFDRRTRVALFNMTSNILNNGFQNFTYRYDTDAQGFICHTLSEVYGQIIDHTSTHSHAEFLNIILSTFSEDSYDSILTLIEYIIRFFDSSSRAKIVIGINYYTAASLYNSVFEKEYVGYRAVNLTITPIIEANEIVEIEDALSSLYSEVQTHLGKALEFLSDRTAPDYANSIKESISAVERMCSIIVGKASTLSEALKKLETVGVNIHPALKGAFDKLYAYTNDSSGIRHAGQLGGATATFEEAKFMLVSCCAFINYLKGVQSKIK